METQVSSKKIQYVTGKKIYMSLDVLEWVRGTGGLYLHYTSLKATQFNAKSLSWSMTSTMRESENV